MKTYLTLISVFTKAVSMSEAQDKRRKVMIVVLSLFAIFGIFLPVVIFSGVIVKLMTETLMAVGSESLGIEIMMYIILMFTIVFGINVIFNELYFSHDIGYLLPLPIKPMTLAASKFTSVFFAENIMEFALVAACVVGYGIASRMPILSWIMAFVGAFTLPIVPLVYCGVLALLLMYFTRLVKNFESIHRITLAFTFIMLLLVIGSISTLQDLDLEHYVKALATGNQTFFKAMRIAFPTIPLFIESFHSTSILAFVEYIAVSAAYMGVFLFLADKLYLDSVIAFSSSQTKEKKVSVDKVMKKVYKSSVFMALFKKELRLLMRSPAYFVNCISINFMWPLLVYAGFKIQHYDLSVTNIRNLAAENDIHFNLFLLLSIIGVSLLMTAVSSLSSNAISREGSCFQFMKYIPVPYFVQWHVKAAISIVFGIAGVWLYYIIFFIVAGVSLPRALILLVVSLLCISLVSYMGILIDSNQPKLIWDDEMSVLRENYNTFFTMALSIMMTAVFSGGGFLLFVKTKISISVLLTIALILLGLANIIVMLITKKTGVRNIAEQEET